MSDKMRVIPFEKMLIWITKELEKQGSIFGVHRDKFYYDETGNSFTLFNEKLSSPIGPAAGPNSQLAQNIVCAYLTGSRFIELKTVQVIDGEEITVAKPCINVQDEGYNVEWSTELKVSEAFDEYIKAWFLLHVLMKELKFTKERDFMFNMSVGYDLKGIKSPKIDAYIEGMRDASSTRIWRECEEILSSHMDMFSEFTKEDLERVSPIICPSITLSTLHGCPANEIESIAIYFLEVKGLHTYIKMNPTLLGEKFVRETLNTMGYDYISLNSKHFINDLQYADAVLMLKRLKGIAKRLNLEIGVKLTNTLPVKIINNELPGEEMYMSGRALYALSISLASKLAREFDGNLKVSYSGGADFFNIDKILSTGINPVTFATTILKPGGYKRITQMAKKVEKQLDNKFSKINVEMLELVSNEAINDKHYRKELLFANSRKNETLRVNIADVKLTAKDILVKEDGRCVACNSSCEMCVDICPNRANVVVMAEDNFASANQTIHLDGMCNECGNCAVFCPRRGKPYKDKITVFWSKEDLENSDNKGFFIEDIEKGICLVRNLNGITLNYTLGQKAAISDKMVSMIKTCINNYGYML